MVHRFFAYPNLSYNLSYKKPEKNLNNKWAIATAKTLVRQEHKYRDRVSHSGSSWRGFIVAACPLPRARGIAFFYARQCCPNGLLGSRL